MRYVIKFALIIFVILQFFMVGCSNVQLKNNNEGTKSKVQNTYQPTSSVTATYKTEKEKDSPSKSLLKSEDETIANTRIINELLGINLEKSVLDEYYNNQLSKGYTSKADVDESGGSAAEITIEKPLKTNLTNSNPGEDIIIKGRIRTGVAKMSKEFIMIYEKAEKRYSLIYKQFSSTINFELVDINADNRNEIILEKGVFSGKYNQSEVLILMFNVDKFISIFDEGLHESDGYFPYTYTNELKISEKKRNSNFSDILFSVETEVDESLYEQNKTSWNMSLKELDDFVFNKKLPKPIREEYTFHYEKDKYIAEKEVFDYKFYFTKRNEYYSKIK